MKKKVVFISLFMALVLAYSCSEPDDDVDINQISNGTNAFAVVRGFTSYDADVTDGNKFDVMLLGSGLSLSDSVSGTGSLVKFSVFSVTNSEIAPGKYTIDGFETHDTLTACGCKVYYNYDFAADTGSFSNITGGIIEFINMGATIKIRLDLVEDYSNSMFEGTFQGILENGSF